MSSLPAAFLHQVTHCEHLGSPFMTLLLRLLAKNWPRDNIEVHRLKNWDGDIGPKDASLPLRLADSLHALAL